MRKELFSQREKERGKRSSSSLLFLLKKKWKRKEKERKEREKTSPSSTTFLLLFFWKEKEEREKKSRIEPFLPLLKKIKKRKRNGIKVFLSVFSSCKRRNRKWEEKRSLSFSSFSTGVEKEGKTGTNTSLFLLLFASPKKELKRKKRGKQGRNGKEKRPCSNEQGLMFLLCFLVFQRLKIFAPERKNGLPLNIVTLLRVL